MPDNLTTSNDNSAPVPINPAGAIMGTPVPPPPTVDQNSVAQRPNAPTAPTPQVQSQDAQHSALGRGLIHVAHALEGKQVNYVPDPQTGQATPVVTPRKPGGFFRDILLGVIAGEAASAQPLPPGSSPLVGFARGAQSGMSQVQQQQQDRQKAAQDRAQQMQAQQQALDKKTLANGQIATDTVNSLNLGHFIGSHTPEELNRYNTSVNSVKTEALNAGGQLAQVPGNGQKGNGPAMMAAFQKDPSLMQGPEGYHRIPFILHDTSDHTHDGEKWQSSDGENPDWNANATVYLVDVPNSMWGKTVTLSKGTANAVAGRQVVKGNDTDSVQTTFGSLFGLGLMNKKDLIAQRQERERGPKDENEATQWVAAAEGADKNSPDYPLIQKRAQFGQNFLDAKSDEKNSAKNVPLVDSPEKAQAALTNAQIALRANPNDPKLRQAVQDAQQRYNDQTRSATEIAKTKKQNELDAQRAIENSDLAAAASNVVNGNLAQIKDLASFRGDQKARLYNMITAEAQRQGKDPKDYSPSALEAKAKVLNDFSDGKAADNIMAFNTFLGHANDALDATAAMRSQAGSPLINRPLNWIRKNAANDTNFTAFQTALVPVRKEFMTFLNNNRAEHDDDLKTMNTVLSDTASPAQIEAALKQLGQSADIRLRQLGRKYSNTMRAAYPDLITPDSQAALARMGIKSELAAQPNQSRATGSASAPNNSTVGGKADRYAQ